MLLFMFSSSQYQWLSILMVVWLMCLSGLLEAANVRAGLFGGSLTQMMQS